VAVPRAGQGIRRGVKIGLVAITAAALLGLVAVVTLRATSGGHRAATPGSVARGGVLPLTAAVGDGVVWLRWSPPSWCASGPFQVERSADAKGPWDLIGAPRTSPSFKDFDLPDGLTMSYQVLAACSGRNVASGTVAVTPNVVPYNWDFGRAVEGTAAMTEGWTSPSTSVRSGRTPTTSTAPSHPKKRKHRNTSTTSLNAGASPALAADPIGLGTGVAATQGYLVTSAPAGRGSVVVSPPGLEMSAQAYAQLAVDVLDPAPPSMKLAWKSLGATGWSQSARCTFAPLRAGESECRFAALGPGWTGTIDQIRLSFPKTATVTVDRVGFSGPGASRPLVGAIRWDGWFPGNQRVDPSLFTDFDSRHPELGWFDEAGVSGGSSAVAQHAVDLVAEMQEAHAGGIDFWAYDWYPGTGGAGGYPSALSDYQSYLASLRGGERPLVDYALILSAGVDHQDRHANSLRSLPYWTKVLVPQLVHDFHSSAYVKLDGNRPLIYWQDLRAAASAQGFGGCKDGCWHLALSSLITQTEAAGFGAPYLVDADSDPADAAKYGLDAVTSYGPDVLSTGGYQNSGHQGWNAGPDSPAAMDVAVARQDSPNGHGGLLAVQPPLTPTLDHRPKNAGTAYSVLYGPDHGRFWFDYPTYSQWQSHFADIYNQLQLYPGRSSSPGVALIYSWNEVAEGGGIQPSSTYGSYLLDAIAAVRSGTEPAYQWNIWDDSNVAVTYAGGWTEEAPSPQVLSGGRERTGPSTPVPGAYNDDEHVDANSGPGDSATITLDPSTAVRVLATTGPDRGIETVTLDGAATQVDLYSPAYRSQVVVFQKTDLPPSSHLLQITTTGRKNARSKNATIGLDAIEALVVGIGRQELGPLPPDRFTASGLDGAAQLSWDPVPGATAYAVYRSGSSGGPWKAVGQVPTSAQRLEWTDHTVPAASLRLWYYRVTASDGRHESPPSEVVPAVTVPDISAGGHTSTGSSPSGQWTQVIFGAPTPTEVDEIGFPGVVPSGPVLVEVTTDGGRTWTSVYRARTAVGLAGARWLTFPAALADGVRVTTQNDPPGFGVYLR
jgi:hypothetical protein